MKTSQKKKMPTAVVIALVLVGVFVLVIGGCEWKMASDLSAAEEKARKEGIALTYAEFRQHLPKPSQAENAADVINKLVLLRPGRSEAESAAVSLLYKSKLTPEEWETIEAVSPQLDQVSALTDSLAGKTAVDFNRKWELGFEVLFPEYAQIKNTIKLISLRARLLAHRGNRLGALRELKKGFVLSELTDTEPTLIAMLVTVSCEAICFYQLNLLTSEGPLSSDERDAIRDIRNVLGDPKKFDTFVNGEAAAVYMTLREGKSNTLLGLNESDAANGFITFMLKTSFRKVVLAEYLRSIVKLKQFASDESLSPKELIIRAESFDRYVATYNKNDFKKSISSIFFPTFKSVAEARTRQVAMRRLIDVVLGDKNALDPFTESPMKTMTVGNGTMYYTVGQNLNDDKGIAYDANGKKISGIDDIVITVPK